MNSVRGTDKASIELARISQRTSGEAQSKAWKVVQDILKNVKIDGDHALKKYTKKFDGFNPDPLTVSQEKLLEAWANTPKELQKALQTAHQRISEFHKFQLPTNLSIKGKFGEELGRRWSPVKRAGIYVPGGRASYPSTVLMNAIPASVAGVEEIIMVSPADTKGEVNRTVLAAAHLSGVNKVIRIGGAQSIGALAYGTETIPAVDIISGPGNIYVTLAKKSVYGKVGIDSLAGPSEILIIADETAKVEHVAADFLAQSEHDPLASAVLITTNAALEKSIKQEINRQLRTHPRKEICFDSLSNWGLIVLCDNIDDCIELSNKFAPEHLELLIKSPHAVLNKIKNAGAIFIGPWTPEAVGDYLAGPNHTLPTCGTAKFSGALSVETFMKNTSIIEFNKTAFENTANSILELANSEGLYSHGESVKVRKDIPPNP